MRRFGPDPVRRGIPLALLVLGTGCGPARQASEPERPTSERELDAARPNADPARAEADEGVGEEGEMDGERKVDVIARRLDVDGAGVHALEAGPESDRGVLLLHGAAFGAHTWEELGTIESLARAGHRVVAVDLPGYGDSDPNEEPPAAFLLALLDRLGLERAVIVSPSMSGRYSLPFLERHPERVAGFVPVAPVGADTLRGPVAVPALVVWGEADRMLPPAGAAELARRFARAEVAILPGARHPAYLDQPERFHELLGAFVASALER